MGEPEHRMWHGWWDVGRGVDTKGSGAEAVLVQAGGALCLAAWAWGTAGHGGLVPRNPSNLSKAPFAAGEAPCEAQWFRV